MMRSGRLTMLVGAVAALAVACGSITPVEDGGRGGSGGAGSGSGGTGAGGTAGRGGAGGGGGRGGATGMGGATGAGGVTGTGGVIGTGGATGAGGARADAGVCNCPTIYMPVCGTDGRTYGNSCQAMCAGVLVAHTGACDANCTANTDCMLYPDLGDTCCGVCQPRNAAPPPPIACILACMNPLKTCTCVSGKCTGGY